MSDLEQKTLGIEQVTQVLRTSTRLKNIIPDLVMVIKKSNKF